MIGQCMKALIRPLVAVLVLAIIGLIALELLFSLELGARVSIFTSPTKFSYSFGYVLHKDTIKEYPVEVLQSIRRLGYVPTLVTAEKGVLCSKAFEASDFNLDLLHEYLNEDQIVEACALKRIFAMIANERIEHEDNHYALVVTDIATLGSVNKKTLLQRPNSGSGVVFLENELRLVFFNQSIHEVDAGVAFFVSKQLSRTIFDDIYNKANLQQCSERGQCGFTWLLVESFGESKHLRQVTSITEIPQSHVSSQAHEHNSTSIEASASSDGNYTDSRSVNPVALATVEGFGSSPICFEMNFTSRLGNVLFQYAALLGVCAKRGGPPATCAKYASMSPAEARKQGVPYEEWWQTFHPPSVTCAGDKSTLRFHFREHGELPYGVWYDKDSFRQPVATVFHGYFQSYKYFHPHAHATILQAYQFGDAISHEAERFMDEVRGNMPKRGSHEIICVSVRRGDKTDKKAAAFYDEWALSEEYYSKAMEYFKGKYAQTMFVFFTGGGWNAARAAADREWTHTHLVEPLLRASAVPSDSNSETPSPIVLAMDDSRIAHDHLVTLKVLTMCPNLIVASSSYSWWGAYLSNHSNVVAPKYLHKKDSGIPFVPEDYYPPTWTLLEP